jgi:hypothetical protein
MELELHVNDQKILILKSLRRLVLSMRCCLVDNIHDNGRRRHYSVPGNDAVYSDPVHHNSKAIWPLV